MHAQRPQSEPDHDAPASPVPEKILPAEAPLPGEGHIPYTPDDPVGPEPGQTPIAPGSGH
ncbi:MAG: hypothetical protein GAK43_02367 [Stenotrophomonas maltophilia]|nr:MAG: hypothetical protein GAK43_02367 [Stenotrophomonas maltophilia]